MQEIRRFKPSTVSRRFSVTAGFYRTCVIDGLLEHSPAEHVRRPAMLGLLCLRIFEATGADIENLGIERGHRTLVITRKGGKVVTVPLAPRTARAIDLAAGERCDGPVFLTGGWTAMAPPGFPVWREDGAVGLCDRGRRVAGSGLGPGHAAGTGILASCCAGCQDVASSSVALGDWMMHRVYSGRGSRGGTQGGAGAGGGGGGGAGFAGAGAV